MNPLTNIKNQNAINERELKLGYTSSVSSWHKKYKESAWIYVGGLDYDLTEGDIICVFSQYGEVANINLVRDRKTGKSKGFCFLCYEEQLSTVLATDNLNGAKVAGRLIRVDHVEKYRVPDDGTRNVGVHRKKKSGEEEREELKKLDVQNQDKVARFVREHGCGPETMREIERLQRKVEAKREKRKRAAEKEEMLSKRCPSPPRRFKHKPDEKPNFDHIEIKKEKRGESVSPPSPPRPRARIKAEPRVVHSSDRRRSPHR